MGCWQFGRLDKPRKTSWWVLCMRFKVECFFQRREGEHLEGTERSLWVTHPTCGPVSQVERKRTSPHLRSLRGKRWLVPTQSKLGHGCWFPAQSSVVRLPQAGDGLWEWQSASYTQGKQAVLLSGKEPVQTNTQDSDQPHVLILSYFPQ